MEMRLPEYTNKSTNKSGYRGVSWDSQSGQWRAGYRTSGKTVHLGIFDDVHDAGCAASDYRLKHIVEINAAYERGRKGKSSTVKAHRASQTREQRRKQALKGHRKRKGLLSSNRSGYKGVSWNSQSKRWYVIVMIDGKKKRLGSYVDVHEAGRVVEAFREQNALA
jgi:hypothetical protein